MMNHRREGNSSTKDCAEIQALNRAGRQKTAGSVEETQRTAHSWSGRSEHVQGGWKRTAFHDTQRYVRIAQFLIL